jgi:protein-tyrosine phosphatase
MIRVLFVCLGNICRSPMAEAVFQHMVNQEGLADQIEADSAGTGEWHIGSAAHPGTLAVLQTNGIAYDGRGRTLHPTDMRNFDYIIPMDNDNLRNVQRLHKLAGGAAKVALLLDFSEAAKKAGLREVPDPYLTGGFENVYSLVTDGAAGLLAAIRREHDL